MRKVKEPKWKSGFHTFLTSVTCYSHFTQSGKMFIPGDRIHIYAFRATTTKTIHYVQVTHMKTRETGLRTRGYKQNANNKMADLSANNLTITAVD